MKITNTKILSTYDELPLDVIIYEADRAKATIQVMHGMAEHKERYDNFAKYLCENGYNIVLSDMRGHGKSILSKDDFGYFAKKNGPDVLINDQVSITNYIIKQFKDTPVYIFAHSMGTLVCRYYLQENDMLVDKVILSGAPYYQPLGSVGVGLANMVSLFGHQKSRSKLLESLATGGFAKSVKNRKTNNDWLSYNEENVKTYNNDELCGFRFTNSGYKTLFQLMTKLNKNYNFENEDLKICFFYGADDPVVGGDKGITSSIGLLNKAGYTGIKKIKYDKMRHEILLENECQKVFADALAFYEE